MRACALILVSTVNAVCSAEWTVTSLHFPGPTQTFGWAVSGDYQAGSALWGYARAGIWSGSASSWLELHPEGARSSTIAGVSGDVQVGYTEASNFGLQSAALWRGTAASFVNLHPAGATQSAAKGASSSLQVGYARVGTIQRASLWSGTAASWVDLNPASAINSVAYDTTDTMQVGHSEFQHRNHAGRWSGTAGSWVDMHPAGATDSYALGVSGETQVGWTQFDGYFHAGIWSGTAESWVDLTPDPGVKSQAYQIDDGIQVGAIFNGPIPRAALWFGSAASMVDLHDVLPSEFLNSEARAVYRSATGIDVVGFGSYDDGYSSSTQALLWHSPVPEPATLTTLLALSGLGTARRLWRTKARRQRPKARGTGCWRPGRSRTSANK